MVRAAAISLVLVATAACSPDYGECSIRCEGTQLCPGDDVCGSDGFCYASAQQASGLSCTASDDDGTAPAGADGGAPADDDDDPAPGLDASGCADGFEPNDALAAAAAINIATGETLTVADLTLCAQEVDHYKINIPGPSPVVIIGGASGPAPALDLMTLAGGLIASGNPDNFGLSTFVITGGTYVIRVTGADSEYSLTIGI
jgi:hypothetical protein